MGRGWSLDQVSAVQLRGSEALWGGYHAGPASGCWLIDPPASYLDPKASHGPPGQAAQGRIWELATDLRQRQEAPVSSSTQELCAD